MDTGIPSNVQRKLAATTLLFYNRQDFTRDASSPFDDQKSSGVGRTNLGRSVLVGQLGGIVGLVLVSNGAPGDDDVSVQHCEWRPHLNSTHDRHHQTRLRAGCLGVKTRTN